MSPWDTSPKSAQSRVTLSVYVITTTSQIGPAYTLVIIQYDCAHVTIVIVSLPQLESAREVTSITVNSHVYVDIDGSRACVTRTACFNVPLHFPLN